MTAAARRLAVGSAYLRVQEKASATPTPFSRRQATGCVGGAAGDQTKRAGRAVAPGPGEPPAHHTHPPGKGEGYNVLDPPRLAFVLAVKVVDGANPEQQEGCEDVAEKVDKEAPHVVVDMRLRHLVPGLRVGRDGRVRNM